MNKKVKIGIIVAITILLSIIGGYFIFGNRQKTEPLPVIKEIDNIEKFGYVLYDNKSELYKTYFEQLKETLNQEEVNESKYAEILATLFVVDFYSLNNKVTNTDVGGLDFIHEQALETFRLKAQDTIYKYIESNVYGERKQKLPEVKNVTVVNIEQTKFESDVVSDELAYTVNLTIEYVEDLKYPKEVKLTIVHVEEKLYIVEVK